MAVAVSYGDPKCVLHKTVKSCDANVLIVLMIKK